MVKKRTSEDLSAGPKTKKFKTAKTPDVPQPSSSLLTEEVDFPRGGGTSFTPLEVKKLRVEAVKEADAELFQEGHVEVKSKKRKRKADGKESKKAEASEGRSTQRIEHLNYKRILVGMKIFGQIVSILPLALVVSLPNQTFGHVPITGITSQFTELLDRMENDNFDMEDDASDDEGEAKNMVPELSDIFHIGQFVRTVVTAVHPAGATDVSGVGRTRDEYAKASKRVELSLVPEKVNEGVKQADLLPNFTLSASIKSREDHGYVLDFGIPDVTGFLSFKDAEAGRRNSGKSMRAGELLDVTVTKVSSNGRIINVSIDSATFASSALTEVTSVTSILPGALVQGLITEVDKMGLHLQLLGFFEGTVDQFHLGHQLDKYKAGKNIKARVLYDYSSSPPRFALALSSHLVKLSPQTVKHDGTVLGLREAYPIGTSLDSVKVLRIEPERGVVVEVEPGVEGYVHISQISDDHIPSIAPAGPWKVNSMHPARVTGYYGLDGILQLSMKSSIIQQKFFQVTDVEVGEVVKATVKKLTDTGLFVTLAGGLDGVIWPNHYADIILKHPGRRFKEGGQVKCKVLIVDSAKKRICLTAKKSLLESSLPIISKIEDAKIGLVTKAVIFKHHPKQIFVEFFNNLKAIVPFRELSETPVKDVEQSFPIGKTVTVRVLDVVDGRVVASIKQSSPSFDTPDISAVDIGDVVQGAISEIHADNAIVSLQPSNIRAILSLKNIANNRNTPLSQLRTTLSVGEKLEDLIVVTRNVEKGFVIVANKPKAKPNQLAKGNAITMDNVKVGQMIGGRVVRHTPQGALIKITAHIGATLHLTDVTDDYSSEAALPPVDSIMKAVVIHVDEDRRQLTLSTRRSRMYPEKAQDIIDPEMESVENVHVGQQLRGFIKNINDHGLFVTIGRGLDARVQIKELFDDFVKEWKERFRQNQLVEGRILSIDPETKRIEMTFRSSQSKRTGGRIQIDDLKAGQKVDGSIKRIEDYGMFIQIDNSKLNGLCHKSELSDNADADVSAALQGFCVGDKVKAHVISVDGKRISLSLKPSHFSDEDFEEVQEEGEGEKEKEEKEEEEEEKEEEEEEKEEEEDASEPESDEESINVNMEDIRIERQPAAAPPTTTVRSKTSQAPSLALSAGFQWNDAPQDEDGTVSSDDGEETDKPAKKRRKRKEIEQDLTADMATRTPQSNADFERLLLGSPNSSYLWIQYMSFQLPLSEIDKAREIARRALKTINFREEQEKLNVWIALLNLENVYGSEDSLEATFKEAARSNDSKTIHLKLAAIFDQSDRFGKADDQYKRTCKKFGYSSKVWTLYGEFLLRNGHVEEARKLLPRSLQSLEKRKHLKTISRFAQLEYKYGDPERGKTLFGGIVDLHPKRWDMWIVFMDMEGTQKNIQSLRNLFDRVLSMKLTSHKAKSFFKKWLELEKRIGDEEGIEAVKQKAVEWTRKATEGQA